MIPKYTRVFVVLDLGLPGELAEDTRASIIRKVEDIFDANGEDQVGPGGAVLHQMFVTIAPTPEGHALEVEKFRKEYPLVPAKQQE